jgi:hypothetical protein
MGTISRIKGVLGGIIDEEPLMQFPLNYDFSRVQKQIKFNQIPKLQAQAAF